MSRCFQAFNLSLEPSDYSQPALQVKEVKVEEGAEEQRSGQSKIQNRTDWGEAPDVSIFHGRIEELATLTKWIQSDRCRLVVLLGMGGIGKTWLAAKLAKLIKDEFEFLIWRSLHLAPPLEAILAKLLGFLSNQPETNISETLDRSFLQLIEHLRAFRCLLVLDNMETTLQEYDLQHRLCNGCAGCYRQGYENYGELLRLVGEIDHQSCLVLTSREKPQNIKQMEGENLPVRVLRLQGLQVAEIQKILGLKGTFSGSQTDWSELVDYYAGNPLVLKIISTTIQNLFDGNIAEFLKQNTAIFGEICALLDQQMERLSGSEKEIMTCLAVQAKPVSVSELRSLIEPQMSCQTLLETLESLEARSLIENHAALFSLHPMMKDYVTERFISSYEE